MSPKVLFIAPLIVFIASCSTRYQPDGFTGGYEEVQLSENIFSVTFSGNGYTKKQKAVDFCLLRCAELTKENGFEYFSIINQNNDVTNTSYTSPSSSVTTGSVNSYGQVNAYTNTYGGQTYNFSKPSTNNTILMHKNKPNEGTAYNASFLIKSIGGKYGIEFNQSGELVSNPYRQSKKTSESKENQISSQESYDDQKKRLLDMYLSKEITKSEYFDLRRELDKGNVR